ALELGAAECLFTDERRAYLKVLPAIINRYISTKNIIQQQIDHDNILLKIVLANAPILLYFIDKTGIIRFTEGNLLTRLGIERRQITGKSVFDLYGENYDVVSFLKPVLEGKSNQLIS